MRYCRNIIEVVFYSRLIWEYITDHTNKMTSSERTKGIKKDAFEAICPEYQEALKEKQSHCKVWQKTNGCCGGDGLRSLAESEKCEKGGNPSCFKAYLEIEAAGRCISVEEIRKVVKKLPTTLPVRFIPLIVVLVYEALSGGSLYTQPNEYQFNTFLGWYKFWR